MLIVTQLVGAIVKPTLTQTQSPSSSALLYCLYQCGLGSWACRARGALWRSMELGQGLKEPLISGLPTNPIQYLLFQTSYSTLFLSHQGEQTMVSEAANPLQQGFHSVQSPILDIRQKEPTKRQLFCVSHAPVTVSRVVWRLPCFLGVGGWCPAPSCSP